MIRGLQDGHSTDIPRRTLGPGFKPSRPGAEQQLVVQLARPKRQWMDGKSKIGMERHGEVVIGPDESIVVYYVHRCSSHLRYARHSKILVQGP